MIRENYIWFWGIFFAVSAIGGLGVIGCLALIVKYLKEICKKLPHSHIKGINVGANE